MISLSDNQKRYLTQRQLGHGVTESARRAKVGRSTASLWRQDKRFKRHDDSVAKSSPSEQPDTSPASIEEFVIGKRYLDKGASIRPVVLDALRDIYGDDEPNIILCCGAIGTGKSFMQAIIVCYEIYRDTCLESPHAAYSLDPDSAIIYAIQNRTQTLALGNNFALIKSMLLGSEYFQRAFPPLKATQDRIVFPNRLEVWGESGDPRSVLGTNPRVFLADEVDFMRVSDQSTKSVGGGQYDQAAEMVSNAASRQASRFYLGGKVRGKLLIASSAHYAGAFSETIENAARRDSSIYVWRHSIWSALPERYSDKMFQVFVGDESREPYIIGPDDEVHPRDRALVLDVPLDFEKGARRDLIKTLMNDAGVRVKAANTFFTNRDTLSKAFRHESIFNRESVISGGDILVDPARIVRPEVPRFCHLDLSKSRDATGLAIGHLAGFVEMERGDQKELLPQIYIDAALRIKPPRHGEISLAWVRSLIYGLRPVLNIVRITADQYQSVDTLQQFAVKGYATGLLSVDRTMAPYENLRDCLADGRIALPRSSVLHKEASTVQLDLRKGKIDHPARGSKDCLDAVVAVAYGLVRDPVQRIESGHTDRLMPTMGSRVTGWGGKPNELEQYMAANDPLVRAVNRMT